MVNNRHNLKFDCSYGPHVKRRVKMCNFDDVTIYSTLIATVLREYNAAFLGHC